MKDEYFNRSEVSNSDLSWLKKSELSYEVAHDWEKAFRFGSLVDAIITEPEKINYFKRTVQGQDGPYTEEEFAIARKMLVSFRRDELCKRFTDPKHGSFQTIMSKLREFEYEGVKFSMNVRCKWDIFMAALGYGADIKSTTATTQKQFEEAIRYFDYDRQRAWYMDIAESDKDMLIGVSKVNYKIFKVPIRRGDELYKSGLEKYKPLAFRYWMLFDLQPIQKNN